MLFKGGKKVQYWFTKVHEWRNLHNDKIVDSILSPDSSTLATLSFDETLRFWKIFESFEDIDKLNTEKASKYNQKQGIPVEKPPKKPISRANT